MIKKTQQKLSSVLPLLQIQRKKRFKVRRMKDLGLDKFKDRKIDPNGVRLYWLLQVVAMEVDRELKKRELQEYGEWEGLMIPKRKRSKRDRPVSPIPPPKLDTESKELKPKRKRKQRRPLRAILSPGLSINFTPHTVLENVEVEKKLKKRKLEDGEWEEEQKPKVERIKKQKPGCPNPPPDLPDNVRRHIVESMGGTGLVLVIQKPLFFSDVNSSASRFSIPFSQITTHDFLNETEVKALDDKNKNSNDSMQVSLLDPSMRQTTHTFNKWVMNNTSLYVMTKPWNDVVNKNGLKENDIVQLWSFRVDSKLCFALVKLEVQPVN